MNRSLVVFLVAAAHLATAQVSAGQVIAPRDAAVAAAVEAVSVENLRVTVDELVALGNRNNVGPGVAAAADYLYGRIEALVPGSGGRLSVERVDYRAGGEGQRIPRETQLTNIVATIAGSDPDDSRVIALLAHYDNRGADPLDGTSFVPGANDNGSGVAALLEIARLLPALAPRATVKLMLLSGEEHGLYGATHMAAVARDQGWNLIAVLNNDMIGNAEASETAAHDNTTLRVFSENIPAAETERERRVRIYNSAENDSPSRQVARYIAECGWSIATTGSGGAATTPPSTRWAFRRCASPRSMRITTAPTRRSGRWAGWPTATSSGVSTSSTFAKTRA